MYRKFWDKLKRWQDENIKEPLLVIGARQIGKTYIIQKFCKESYSDYVYFNFEEKPDLVGIFNGNLQPENILQQLSITEGRVINENTAIIFDEIQKCEMAVTALKYFCESEKNYRIIAAGSLLGVKLSRFEGSFPVGKVTIEQMYSMDFEEFLIACGQNLLISAIKKSFSSFTALPEPVHNKAMSLYRDYLIIGGMPACVKSYLDNERSEAVLNRDIHKNILLAYQADMSKYTLGAAESLKISETFDSIPRQLAKENPKFKYKEIRANANKRDFYTAIDWLKNSGMVIKVDKIELPQSPLKAFEDINNFRLYMADVGLMSELAGVSYKNILPTENNIFKGILTENYVVQQLTLSEKTVFYYKPDATMEIDALIDIEGEIVPIEVKSGRHKRSTSLKNFNAKYAPKRLIRLSENNFGKADNLLSVPLYAIFCV